MKKWKNYLLSIMAVAGFVACSDDDPGLAPVIDGTDLSIELKRDTADVYKISVPIKSEEGLVKVSLVDNSNNNAIDEQTSFSNPNDYTYNYDFDLTPYTDNTVVMLTLKIEDKEGQVVNKKITLTVKKFSELDVRFATESTIVSQFEDCNLKVTVVRGFIPLKEIQVYVGTNLMETFDLTLDSEQDRYGLNVLVKGLQMGDNDVKVVVVDEKDQKFDKSIKINRVETKIWSDVNQISFNPNTDDPYGIEAVGVEINRDAYGELPGDDKLYRLSFSGSYGMESLEFEYDGDKVSKMTHVVWDIDWTTGAFIKGSYTDYNYQYNTNGELQKVTMEKGGESPTDYITDVVYESGNIKGYKVNGSEYTPKYMEKNGEMIRADYQDADLSGWEYDFANAKPNPMYMPELPAVIPGSVFGYELNNLYNRYLFETLKDGDATKISYTVSDIQREEEEWEGKIYVTIWQDITWSFDGKNQKMSIRYNE